MGQLLAKNQTMHLDQMALGQKKKKKILYINGLVIGRLMQSHNSLNAWLYSVVKLQLRGERERERETQNDRVHHCTFPNQAIVYHSGQLYIPGPVLSTTCHSI